MFGSIAIITTKYDDRKSTTTDASVPISTDGHSLTLGPDETSCCRTTNSSSSKIVDINIEFDIPTV